MPTETKAARAARMRAEYALLVERYPRSYPTLDFRNPFEMTVATVLSAQTTDRRVNMVTPALFAAYPTPQALAQADIADVEKIIHELGFFHTKAKHIIALAQGLCERFDGVVPQTMEELTSLPGVGRKTANVVLGDAFNKPGFPVDTHVTRTTSRLRWHTQWRRTHPDVVVIEKQVTAVFPPEEWRDISHRLIFLGRDICHPRKPACEQCPLNQTCPFAAAQKRAQQKAAGKSARQTAAGKSA